MLIEITLINISLYIMSHVYSSTLCKKDLSYQQSYVGMQGPHLSAWGWLVPDASAYITNYKRSKGGLWFVQYSEIFIYFFYMQNRDFWVREHEIELVWLLQIGCNVWSYPMNFLWFHRAMPLYSFGIRWMMLTNGTIYLRQSLNVYNIHFGRLFEPRRIQY